MDVERVRIELLRPAADGLRRALRRMDEEDVPAGLRTLADSADRKLPPPILRKALEELANSDWLRAETANEVEFETTSASGLFVGRPEGWEAKLADLIESAVLDKRGKQAGQEARALAASTEKIARLEAELKAAQARSKEKVQEAKERLAGKVRSADLARREAVTKERAARREVESHAAEVARLTAEMAELETKLETQRQLLERERRAAETPVETTGETGGRGWFPSQPGEMAAELDRIVLATRRVPLSPTPAKPDDADLTLPAGIRPDRVEAVNWLVGRPATWLVDGYNLAFQLKAEPTPATRDRIEAALTRLVSLSLPVTKAVLVFDSEDESSPPGNRRVRRVFAQSADDWILAQAGPGDIVVSSDRRVREGAQSAGAVGIWSEAVAEWIRQTR